MADDRFLLKDYTMKLTKLKLKQLIEEELVILKEGGNAGHWDVSKRTEFPRHVSQILSALRNIQNIVKEGHLDEEEPISPIGIEEIKKIFDHPGLATLKELAGIEDDKEAAAEVDDDSWEAEWDEESEID